MYLGKTLFAQIMDFLPWKTFHRIVDRYSGDYRTRSLSCALPIFGANVCGASCSRLRCWGL